MIDTHCHIDDPLYQDDIATFIAQQQAAGVEAILVPGVDSGSIATVLPLCQRFPHYLYPALGLHPENIQSNWQHELQTIYQAILTHRTDMVAIGEIGLDYHFSTEWKEQQIEAFRQQMDWAAQLHLPVMIHSRDATEDTLQILKAFPSVTGVMHCFSGSAETAQQVLDLGYCLGIGGVLTFKNCKLSETLTRVPLSRLVLETDAPYMAPVPHRGERNESRWMEYVVKRLAAIYSCSENAIIEATNAQTRALFGIK